MNKKIIKYISSLRGLIKKLDLVNGYLLIKYKKYKSDIFSNIQKKFEPKNTIFKEIKNKDLSILIKRIKNKSLNFNNYKINSISFKDINLDNINSDNFIIIFSAFSGAIIALLMLLIICLPLKNQNNLIKDEIDTMKLKKKNMKKIINQFNLSKENIINLQQKKSFLIKLIGGTKNLNTLLTMLNDIAIKNNVLILNLEPIEVISYKEEENEKSKSNQQLINNTDNVNLLMNNNQTPQINKEINSLLTPELEEHIVNIELKGYFQEILEFLRSVESLESIVVSKDIKILRLKDISNESLSEIEYKTQFSAFGKKNE